MSDPAGPTPTAGAYDPPSPATTEQIVEVSRRMLSGGLWPALVVGVLAIVVAGVLEGGSGVAAATVGLVVVLASCALGPLVMRWTAGSAPLVVMGIAMVSFVGKLVVLFLVFLAISALDLVDTRVAALALGAAAMAFIIGEAVAFARADLPTIAS